MQKKDSLLAIFKAVMLQTGEPICCDGVDLTPAVCPVTTDVQAGEVVKGFLNQEPLLVCMFQLMQSPPSTEPAEDGLRALERTQELGPLFQRFVREEFNIPNDMAFEIRSGWRVVQYIPKSAPAPILGGGWPAEI